MCALRASQRWDTVAEAHDVLSTGCSVRRLGSGDKRHSARDGSHATDLLCLEPELHLERCRLLLRSLAHRSKAAAKRKGKEGGGGGAKE
jgi:hypothetical protein